MNNYNKVLPVLLINSWTPSGVHGPKHCISKQNLPILTILKPSTSFCGETALHIVRSVIWSGNGNYNKTYNFKIF